ncbi:hypothetical protein EJ02DRAFT_512614 [Clathrospora elynae]|uniref:Uncharacterized protein n=1 Tax=Clathrospora elynae TaxID=706981 RepID=A0A6A5SNI8_9PLEO|nr:hypothetical protein EJ02DRAFT_512614 [Clathrospora elynae]
MGVEKWTGHVQPLERAVFPQMDSSLSHAPPPPPPPPPGDVLRNIEPTLLQHLGLDKLEQEHEDLQDSREDLLGSRFRLRANRNDIRTVREETGAREGSVIQQLRLLLHEKPIGLPHDIETALEEVHQLRDRLGSLEAEYEEAEGFYNSQEMNYARKEARFVDNLLKKKLPPQDFPTLDAPTAKAAGLTRFADGFRNGSNDPASTIQISSFNEPVSSKGPVIPQLQPSHQSLSSIHRATSARSLRSLGHPAGWYSDTLLYSSRLEWTETKKNIEDWLLDMILKSPFQQALLNAMDRTKDLDEFSCGEQLTAAEQFKISAINQSHTGDSRFSRGIISLPPSAMDLAVVESDVDELEGHRPTTLLLRDQTVDTLEEPEISLNIKADDLCDIGYKVDIPAIQQNHKEDEATPSVSTGLVSTQRTFSTKDLASMTTIDGTYSCFKCGVFLLPPGHPVCERNLSQLGDRSIPVISKQHGKNTGALDALRESSGLENEPEQFSTTQATTVSKHRDLATPGRMPRENEDGQSNPVAQMGIFGTPTLNPAQTPLPLSPDLCLPDPAKAFRLAREEATYSSEETTTHRKKLNPPDKPLILILKITRIAVGTNNSAVQKLGIDWLPFVPYQASDYDFHGRCSIICTRISFVRT